MEPKVKITTKKGTVFNSMQDYRKASASAGVPLDDMSDDQIIEQFSKPRKEGEPPAITVQYGTTDQPPDKTGLTAVPGAVTGEFSERGKTAAEKTSSVLYPVAKAVSELVSGAGSGVLAIPTSVMRFVGIDPSKTQVPTSYSFGGQVSGMPVGGAPAPILATPFQKKPEEGKQEPLTFGQLEKELEPKTLPGEIGRGAMDLYTFGKARGGLGAIGTLGKAKLPSQVATVLESPKVQFALDKAANFGLSLFQEYGKHGDAREAAAASTTGALWDLGLSGVGKTISSLYKKYGQPVIERWASEAVNKAIPIIKGAKRTEQQDIEYKRELAKRLLLTGGDFTEAGAKALENRFSKTVEAMKDASNKADDMLEELHKMNLIPESDLRQVDYVSEIKKRLDEFKRKQVTPDKIQRIEYVENQINALRPKKFKLDSSGNKIPVQTPKIDPATKKLVLGPDGKPVFENAVDAKGNPLYEVTDELEKMTFKEAEDFKERLNSTLKGFYEDGVLSTEDKLDKQVKMAYADATRAAQKNAFDSIEKIKNKLDPKIPVGSPVKKTSPWMVNVPGEAKPVSYQDASLIAMKDADLSKAAWEARTLLEPQAGKSQINEPAAMIALGQFIHGSLFTPSQLATAWQQTRNQESKTLWAQRWRRSAPDLRLALPEKVQPFTRVPPSMVGKSAAIISRKEHAEPTSSMQRLLEEQEVKPLPTSDPAYFRNRQMQ